MDLFSTWARTHMAGITWAGKSVGVALLTGVGTLDPDLGPGVDALLNSFGYREFVDPEYTRVTAPVASATAGTPPTTTVTLVDDFELAPDTQPIVITSAVYYLVGTHSGTVNPWLFISDRTFGQMLFPGSLITTRDTPDFLLSFTPRGSEMDAVVGNIVRSPGDRPWEPPRVQHVWLFPQRINWVINSSFEDVGKFGWRSDDMLTRQTGGVDHPANHYLAVEGTRLEGIPVTGTKLGPHRCSAYIRSTGATEVQIGLSCWQIDWTTPTDSLGPVTPVAEDLWMRVDALVDTVDLTAGIGLAVVSDGPFDIDLALVEQTGSLHNYFDGDSQTSFDGDYSWQGTSHQSLSFWYNNRYLVGARLFGEYTDGLVTKKGLVYDWVPESTAIYTHWDVLYVNDPKQPWKNWPSPVI